MYTWSGELFITWHTYASLGMHCVQDKCLEKRLQVSRPNSYCSRTSLKVTSFCTARRSPPSSFSLLLQEWHSTSPWNIGALIFLQKVFSVISLKNTQSKQGIGSDFDIKETAVILQQWETEKSNSSSRSIWWMVIFSHRCTAKRPNGLCRFNQQLNNWFTKIMQSLHYSAET